VLATGWRAVHHVPLVFTKNPEDREAECRDVRMQIYDERTTGMHWQTQKHGAEHFRRAREKNPEGRIPVSVAIGADPATALAECCRFRRLGRDDVRGIFAERTGRDGAVRDE